MAKEGDPLVCRLLNHGKHIFDAKKQKAASKKKQKRQQIKEIKFRPVTEKNDYEIKVNKIKSFNKETPNHVNKLKTDALNNVIAILVGPNQAPRTIPICMSPNPIP